MKILILANNDVGLYKFRKELLAMLVKKNEVYASLPNGSLIKKIEDIGCHYIDTDFNRRGKNVLSDIKLFFSYLGLIKKIKPDIVLTYTIKPNVYGGLACGIMNIPYIANITGFGSAIENGGLLSKLTLFLYKTGLKKAKMVFFQNEENKKYMLDKNIIKGNYDLLPGSGVNVEDYKLLEYPNGQYTEFCFVSRIIREKGIDEYLAMAKYIKEKYQNTVFHICGAYDDENYKKIIDEYETNGIIIYHGQVENMIEIYQRCDCLIHPSFYPEGISNVLLESLASGRPIITTNRPGCKEVVDDNINGFLVREKDADDLIQKVEKFLSLSKEERNQMGINGRFKIEKYFNRDIVINKYLEVIDKYGK